jgi:hypothetical protein
VLYLSPGTVNTLVDGAASTRDGAIHCKTRLSIFGPGTLNVTGNVDDGINAQGGIVIEEGVFAVRSLESGIKSDISVIVNGGEITVARSVEGLEGARVTVAGGSTHIASSDDAINTSSGSGGAQPGGAPGMGETGSNPLYVRGGYVYANADGDGLDINGPVEMTGGTIIIDGPTRNDNGALDYLRSFEISAGYLLAVGSAGMAEAPSQSSTQNSIGVVFGAAQPAGTLVHVAGPAGEDVLTFRPAKAYQTVVLSSSLIARGTGYSVSLGGSSSGTEKDGLFSGGTYSGGVKKATFDVTGTLTVVKAN